jgi:nitrate reductase gamma subunit
MDWFSFLVAGVMVYLAVFVFITGMLYQIYRWLSVPKTNVRLGIFPKPKSKTARLLKLAKDSFIFPQAFEIDRKMWFFAILFHFALLAVFIGHLRLIQEFSFLFNILGNKGVERFAFISGGSMGIILTVALLYYFSRRFKSPYKDLSVPEDYLLLILLMLVVTMGNHMRFFGDVRVADYREYVHSLFVFKPAFNLGLSVSLSKYSLVAHVFFANLLFIYFPFSKLVHAIGTFAANLIRSE